MNKYDRKIERIEKHLEQHSGDWQSVIALLKSKSDRFLKIEEERHIEKIKRAYAFKKEYDKRGVVNVN